MKIKESRQKIFFRSITFLALCASLCISFEITARSPAVAGFFYPKDTDELVQYLTLLFESVPDHNRSLPDSVILIAPHAGYDFSSKTAVTAYAALKGKVFDHIVLLGSRHEGLPEPGISVFWAPEEEGWQTPLGKTPIDPMAKKLASALNGVGNSASLLHSREHALEVQLPFIQTLFGDQPILPILVNEFEAAHLLVSELEKHFSNKKVLYIVSTDLSHYLPAKEAEEKDRQTITAIAEEEPSQVRKMIEIDSNRMCGSTAVYAAMALRKRLGLPPFVWTSYSQSGDSAANKASTEAGVVGYVAGLTLNKTKGLSSKEGEAYLKYARQTLESLFSGAPAPKKPSGDASGGVFVTLKKEGQLRGCIGTLDNFLPLSKAIQKYTKEAAFNDPRFKPLTAEEVPFVTIELSILSPPSPIGSYQEIVPDQDGAVLTYQNKGGLHQGVFLPEVWKGMDRTNFFKELCFQKAHVQPSCYLDKKAHFQNFKAQIFSE